MRIITKKKLSDFWKDHPDAETPLLIWYRTVSHAKLQSFGDVRKLYPGVDKVSTYFIFNIGGNKYRLITAMHFNTQKVFIREVLTHAQYDKNQWKK